MKKLYYFFDMDYENVVHPPNLPFRLILESAGYIGLHWHPDTEILFMLKGSVRVMNSRGTWLLSEGDIIFINSNEIHSLVEESENIMLVLQIGADVFSEIAGGMREYSLTGGNEIAADVLDLLRHDLAVIGTERWDSKPGNEFFCVSAMYHFAGLINRFTKSEPQALRDNGLQMKQLRVKSVLDYLQQNYRERITLNDVAGALDLSPYYISHLVKEGTGRSFQENLNLIRTGKAVNMMMNSGKSLLDISIETGFSDPKYFNKYFSRLFGLSPKQMKRQPDWKEAVLKHFNNDGLDPEYGRELLKRYLK